LFLSLYTGTDYSLNKILLERKEKEEGDQGGNNRTCVDTGPEGKLFTPELTKGYLDGLYISGTSHQEGPEVGIPLGHKDHQSCGYKDRDRKGNDNSNKHRYPAGPVNTGGFQKAIGYVAEKLIKKEKNQAVGDTRYNQSVHPVYPAETIHHVVQGHGNGFKGYHKTQKHNRINNFFSGKLKNRKGKSRNSINGTTEENRKSVTIKVFKMYR
jgi:hypothetical protein